MTPAARFEAYTFLTHIKLNGPPLTRESITNHAALIIESHGVNPHTAWQQAKELYREVFEA